jgi:hypothetical protein
MNRNGSTIKKKSRNKSIGGKDWQDQAATKH